MDHWGQLKIYLNFNCHLVQIRATLRFYIWWIKSCKTQYLLLSIARHNTLPRDLATWLIRLRCPLRCSMRADRQTALFWSNYTFYYICIVEYPILVKLCVLLLFGILFLALTDRFWHCLKQFAKTDPKLPFDIVNQMIWIKDNIKYLITDRQIYADIRTFRWTVGIAKDIFKF